VLRLVWLVFLVFGLMSVSVVDADGDPSTTNLPSVVLAVETRRPARDDTRRDLSDVDVDRERTTWPWLARRARRLGVGAGQHGGHPRVRPIRGP
jgi:hypothetical protein